MKDLLFYIALAAGALWVARKIKTPKSDEQEVIVRDENIAADDVIKGRENGWYDASIVRYQDGGITSTRVLIEGRDKLGDQVAELYNILPDDLKKLIEAKIPQVDA